MARSAAKQMPVQEQAEQDRPAPHQENRNPYFPADEIRKAARVERLLRYALGENLKSLSGTELLAIGPIALCFGRDGGPVLSEPPEHRITFLSAGLDEFVVEAVSPTFRAAISRVAEILYLEKSARMFAGIDEAKSETERSKAEHLLDELLDKHNTNTLNKSNSADYNSLIMDETLDAIETLSRNLRRPVETIRAQLGIDEAGRAATRRTKAKPRGTAKLRGTAKSELNAARLQATYEILGRESDLANPKLSTEERMGRAIHLRKTYDRLRKLDPSFHDDGEQLRLARKLLNARAYQRRKAAKLAAAA